MEDLKMVYITHYGEKYHIDANCIYVKDKITYKVSLIEAKKKDRHPCKGCCFNNNNNHKNNNNYYNNNPKKNNNFYNNKNNKIEDKKSNNIKNNNKKRNNYQKNKYNNFKYQNENKKNIIKNYINSEDADDEIFNSYSRFVEENINKEKEIKKNNENSKVVEKEEESEFKIQDKNSNIFNIFDNDINKIGIKDNEINDMIISDSLNNNFLKNSFDSESNSKNDEKEKELKNYNKNTIINNNINKEKKNLYVNDDKNDNIKKIENIIENSKKKLNKNNKISKVQKLKIKEKNILDSDDNTSSIKSEKKTLNSDDNRNSIKSEKIFINTDDSIKSEKNSTDRDNRDNIKNNIKSEKKSKNSDNNSSSIISEKKSGGGENFQINPINLNLNSNSNCLNVNNIRQFQFQQNQYVSLAKKAINYNNYNLKLNCQKNDMFFLQETYNNAILLSFEKSILFDNIADNKINGNGLAFKDSYMFTFEITPIKEEINSYLKIEVGFKIKYINIQDMNLIIDEKLINKEYINFQIGSLYDSLKIKKKLIIFKRTSIIYILINISRGKFFIIGKEELLKRKQNIFLNKTNTETFFIKNFFPIASISLKNIEPIFNFDKNDLKYYDIKINDKKIKI